jgi:hypothetical protein
VLEAVAQVGFVKIHNFCYLLINAKPGSNQSRA